MRTNYDNISLLTLSRQQPDPATLCITVGVLYDNQQQVVPLAEALPWLAARFDGQPFDRGLKKSRGTFTVQGSAYPQNLLQQTQGMAVKAKVGDIAKTLHIHPPRRWEQGLLGWTSRICDRLTPLPLDFKQAFGGKHWPDNPEGCGYEPDANQRVGLALPQIENEKATLFDPDQLPALASFLPLPPQCRERRAYWGTIDQYWIRQRAPWPPLDCDDRWFDEVAQDQINPDYWSGDEYWEAIGMHPEQIQVSGRLPSFRPRLFIIRHAQPEKVEQPPLQLDTVCLFPDVQRVLLFYRCELHVTDVDGEDISALGAVCERHDMPAESADVWCQRLWPSASIQQLATPAPPPAVDTAAMVQKMQAVIDTRFSTFATEQDKVLAQVQDLKQRLGQTTPCQMNRLTPPVLSASPVVKTGASRPFDAKAMKAGIESEIAKAKNAAQQHLNRVAQQMNITPAQLQEKINQIRHATPPSHDLTAVVDKLSISPERKATLKAQITQGIKKAKAVEADINSRIAAVLAKIAPASSLKATPQFIWTREALEEKHTQQTPLSGERFVNLDLSAIDLSHATLRHCLFDNCLLTGACLSGIDLSECTLQNCDLSGADLQQSTLDGALLQTCRLDKARFNQSCARRLMARDCQFSAAEIKNAKWPQAVLVDCSLSGIKAEKIDISAGYLQRCDLSAIDLRAARLDKLLLDNCELDHANMTKARLRAATWSASRGENIDLSHVQAAGIRFDRSCQLPALCLNHAILTGASLQDAQLPACSLREANLNNALVTRCNLSDSDGYHLVARSADFTGSDLSRARWQGANLLEARLRKVQLTGIDLSGSNLHAALCEGSHGTDVILQGALLTRCRLKEELIHA